MSILSRLFGGRAAAAPEPEVYQGFRIFPEPAKEAGGYRLAARVEKEVGGAVKTHRLIRADVFQTEEEARSFAIAKARQIVDQLGEGMFR